MAEHPRDGQSGRKRGCFLLAVAAFLIWAGGAWLLWHLTLNSPVKEGEDSPTFFELMPRAEGS